MKIVNIIISIIVVLLFVLVINMGLKKASDKQDSDNEDTGNCVKVNRNKFSTNWIEDKIPGGTIGEIASDIFGSSAPEYGNIVSGFFKSIDVYPSSGAGKYFKKQIIAYYNSPMGLPRWQVIQGELACSSS